WSAARDLPAVEWPSPPPRPRAVEDLRRVLREGEGPLLLGAAQLLVDGGKLALQRAAPDPKVVRDLWALLPYSTRCEVRPATFAFSDRLGCDLMILPEVPQQEIGGYMTEEQALDYPDSRYERNLQIA